MLRRLLSGVGIVVALSAVPPSVAVAEEEQEPQPVTFTLGASNGYRLVALADISAPSGEGAIGVFLQSRSGLAYYLVPAKVTRRTIDANLGKLGRISVTRVVTDRMKSVPRGCRKGRTKRVRAQRYEGTIEFRGEEGFTEISADRAPIQFMPIECFGREGGGSERKELPGARLDVERRRRDEHRIEFTATQRRPGARTAVSAEITEDRGRMYVQRATWTWAKARMLRYDRRLRTATVRPPAPFSGHGTFRRNASRARRWTGNLTADFPGRSNVRLTGRSFFPTLEHPTR